MLSDIHQFPQGPLLSLDCKPQPSSTRTPTRRLLLLDSRQSSGARRFPKASHIAPILRRTAWLTASSLVSTRPAHLRPNSKQPVAPNPPPNPVEDPTPGIPRSRGAITRGVWPPGLPCRRPLLEVVPPRTMSWRCPATSAASRPLLRHFIAPAASPGFGLLFLSSDSDRFRPCRVRIWIVFRWARFDSDRFRRAGFGFGSQCNIFNQEGHASAAA